MKMSKDAHFKPGNPMRFKPGVSGNPRGRPKQVHKIADFLAAVEKGLAEGGLSLEERAITLLKCGNDTVIARVWEKLMSWKYGEPEQTMKHVFELGNLPRREWGSAGASANANPGVPNWPN